MQSKQVSEAKQPPSVPSEGRIVSIDVLRGFDMFWIVGGTGFIAGIVKLFGQNVQDAILPQFDHTAWAGFTFYDLIFPLFLFVVGMTTVFSLEKIIAREGKKAAYIRILRRSALLFLLGVIYYGGFKNEWENIRWLGVLQRIALCYMFASLLFLNLRLKGLIIACVALLAGYWALLSFVPVPDSGTVTFESGKNWACYIDMQYLGGRKHNGTWDPEGLLSTFPAIATCLLGIFAGMVIKAKTILPTKKVVYFIGAGIIGVILGYLWGLQFPIIKKIWTSSYVLLTAGYSSILVGIFYYIVDVLKFQIWTKPFIWIGTNAITIYMARNILDFNKLGIRFVGGDIQTLTGPDLGYLLKTTASLGLTLLLVWFLHRKKIFLRL
ncbi:DUF5009 domain-containing protein [candidate division KSB1 bacterium]|nr:DUF5009 domain-containing protein [candidate division KSB1 bacterium]